MPEFVCPACQAEIERDLIEKTSRAECPFCAADLSAIGLPEPEPLETADASRSADLADAVSTAEITRPLPPVPEESRIKVVESTPERLVLFIPGGGKQTGGLGCFALVWNGFMSVFTPLMIGGMMKDPAGNPPPLHFLIPFLGLFWAVGLGMAYFWLKFKYERTFVLLDRERIAVQTILFHRKRLDERTLGPDSRADLVESYQQNEKPVYRIEVRGPAGAAKFGTALANPEKDWLVDRINDFLGVRTVADDDEDEEDENGSESDAPALTYPSACEKCGAPLAGTPALGALTCEHCRALHRGTPTTPTDPSAVTERPIPKFERLTAESLPEGSAIRLLESSPERLAFRTSLPSGSPYRYIVPLFVFPFALVWYSFIGFFIWNILSEPMGVFGVIHLLFMVPFVVVGLMPLGLGLYALAGSTTVDLTRERLSCRWGVGPLGWSRQIPVENITSVRIESFSDEKRNRRIRRAGSGSDLSESRACVVRGGGKTIPLTVIEEPECARQVGALVRTKLEDWGHTLVHG